MAGSGCVLGELKSPKCFYTVCDNDDLPESYKDLNDKETLQTVLAGGFKWADDGSYSYNPDSNWPLVHDFVRKGKIVVEELFAKKLVQLKI